jgi:hypothetical protein
MKTRVFDLWTQFPLKLRLFDYTERKSETVLRAAIQSNFQDLRNKVSLRINLSQSLFESDDGHSLRI